MNFSAGIAGTPADLYHFTNLLSFADARLLAEAGGTGPLYRRRCLHRGPPHPRQLKSPPVHLAGVHTPGLPGVLWFARPNVPHPCLLRHTPALHLLRSVQPGSPSPPVAAAPKDPDPVGATGSAGRLKTPRAAPSRMRLRLASRTARLPGSPARCATYAAGQFSTRFDLPPTHRSGKRSPCCSRATEGQAPAPASCRLRWRQSSSAAVPGRRTAPAAPVNTLPPPGAAVNNVPRPPSSNVLLGRSRRRTAPPYGPLPHRHITRLDVTGTAASVIPLHEHRLQRPGWTTRRNDLVAVLTHTLRLQSPVGTVPKSPGAPSSLASPRRSI